MARQAGMAKQQSRNTSEEVEGSVAVGEAVQGGHVELRAQTQHKADLHPDVQWKERVTPMPCALNALRKTDDSYAALRSYNSLYMVARLSMLMFSLFSLA